MSFDLQLAMPGGLAHPLTLGDGMDRLVMLGPFPCVLGVEERLPPAQRAFAGRVIFLGGVGHV